MRYLDDLHIGETQQLGTHQLTMDEIISYSREWDPHPIHVNPDSPEARALGGVIAAGTHLLAITIKLQAETLADVALVAGVGWDEVRFRRPGRPGDRLSVSLTCHEILPSSSKPDRGIVRHLVEMHNHRGELVMSYMDSVMVRRKPGS